MKKLCIALAVLALGIASCQGEDLVRGSLPPREQVKITADTGQIIIYFKGEIYPASLVTANIFVYESEGNTLNKLDFDVVFGTTGFPILRQATTVNDTLVLPFKSSFDLQPGKTYGLVMDNYQLLCAIEEEIPPGCLIRNYAFKMVFELATPDVYEPPYNEYNETYKNEDPPYVKRASPPDEIDFKDMNPSPPFPPFPPHGAIDIEFSEPLPNITLAAAADQTSIGDTIFSMIPEDVLILNGDSPGYFVPFDSNRHEHFLATTVKGWPINKTISFYMISIPRNLPEVIAECTAPEATSCTKPPLANIVLAPTRDASYAPIIMAGASAMVETSPSSGVYNGFYHQPAGEPGADGTEPDNIDILVHTARVRIDYPRAGGYFKLTNGNTISGVYYKEDPPGLEHVNTVMISVNGADSVTAALSNGAFTYHLESGFTIGNSYTIKAYAHSNDKLGGFDVIQGIATNDTTPPSITIIQPIEGSTIFTPVPYEVKLSVSDVSGVVWVKVNGSFAVYSIIDSIWIFSTSALPDGKNTFVIQAMDGAGNLATVNVSAYFYLDSDSDGLPDWWEIYYGLNPNDKGGDDGFGGDPDDDGLWNGYEFMSQTNPWDADSDDDGLLDGYDPDPVDPNHKEAFLTLLTPDPVLVGDTLQLTITLGDTATNHNLLTHDFTTRFKVLVDRTGYFASILEGNTCKGSGQVLGGNSVCVQPAAGRVVFGVRDNSTAYDVLNFDVQKVDMIPGATVDNPISGMDLGRILSSDFEANNGGFTSQAGWTICQDCEPLSHSGLRHWYNVNTTGNLMTPLYISAANPRNLSMTFYTKFKSDKSEGKLQLCLNRCPNSIPCMCIDIAPVGGYPCNGYYCEKYAETYKKETFSLAEDLISNLQSNFYTIQYIYSAGPGGNQYWRVDDVTLNTRSGYFLEPEGDFDQDGLANAQEVINGTKLDIQDSDGGGEWDRAETESGRNPLSASDDRGYALYPQSGNTLIPVTQTVFGNHISILGKPRGFELLYNANKGCIAGGYILPAAFLRTLDIDGFSNSSQDQSYVECSAWSYYSSGSHYIQAEGQWNRYWNPNLLGVLVHAVNGKLDSTPESEPDRPVEFRFGYVKRTIGSDYPFAFAGRYDDWGIVKVGWAGTLYFNILDANTYELPGGDVQVAGFNYPETWVHPYSSAPSLAWNNNRKLFGLAYGEDNYIFSPVSDYDDLYRINFIQIDETGAQVGNTVYLTTEDHNSDQVKVIWTEDGYYDGYHGYYALVWREYPFVDKVYFAMISGAGNLIMKRRLSVSGSSVDNLEMFDSGSEFSIIWMESGNIKMSRVSKDGYIIDSEKTIAGILTSDFRGWDYDYACPRIGVAFSEPAPPPYRIKFRAIDVVDPVDDNDQDGLSNGFETAIGSNPCNIDTDGEGLTDYDEIYWYFTDPTNADSDGDGLSDKWEVDNKLNPNNPDDGTADSDGDGIPDYYEILHDCLNPSLADSNTDSDQDGLSNGEEYAYSINLNPCDDDTDNDEMHDGWEIDNGFNPLSSADGGVADADTDGLSNVNEFPNGTNPHDPDTDDDGVEDGDEVAHNCSPVSADTDDDGLSDKAEIVYGTQCNNANSDADQMPDGWELYFGLNPLNASDELLDGDTDSLTNRGEYEHGTNPLVKDSDNDGYDDFEELGMVGRNPALHEEPLIFAVFPGVAEPGDTITILGYRLRDGTTVLTSVSINAGLTASANCNGDTISICAKVPANAASFTTGTLTVSAQIDGAAWSSASPYFPYKVAAGSATEKAESEPGPTEIALFPGDAVNAYGLIRYGDKDYYKLYLADRSVVTIQAQAFNALANTTVSAGKTPGIFAPDTYLELTDKNANLIAQNDTASPDTTNAALNELVLDAGTYYVKVTVPEVEIGNTSQGYYQLSVSSLESPYITDVSPAIAFPTVGETIAIQVKGANFATAGNNSVSLWKGGIEEYVATITQDGTTSISFILPADLNIDPQIGDGYTIVVTNTTTSHSSLDPEVLSHNSAANFYLLDYDGNIGEHAYGAEDLKEGDTAMGFVGPERGKFRFSAPAGTIIMAYMQFYGLDGFAITGAPEVGLLAPDGSAVSLHPEDPANSGGLAQDLYALPQSGQYTLLAQGTPGAGLTAYYKLSYLYQPAPSVTSLSIIPADYLILPVVRGGTTVLDGMTVQITAAQPANIPVIFKMPDKEYLFFTGADGKASASGLRTPKPPIQDRILIYPAGHLELKKKFNFILIEAYSRQDWDGDGITNDAEISGGTDPRNPWSLGSGNTLDGYPLSLPAPDDSDGDGMGNSVEYILGTEAGDLDTDDDGYPDGFEVMNQMDPINKDAANIKVIPLGAELGYGETIRVHASAKDYTGHLRKSIPVAAPYAGHNFGHSSWQGSACSSFTPSSARGVSTCLVITSQMDDGKQYPMQSAPVEAYGFNHFITARVSNADGSTVSDKMYFVVFPKGEDPLVKWSGDGQGGHPYTISDEIVVKTNKWDPRTSSWMGAAGRKVVFRVLDPVQAKPSNFSNAQLSKRHTWTVAPFDYPGIWPLLGDDGRDAVDELTVYTDSYGYASARFYFGDTDNMDYRIEASLPEEAGQVIVFTVHADPVITHSSYPPPSTWLFSEVIKEPETALEGSDLPVRVHVKKFSALDSILCADPLGTCPVKMEPKVDFPVNIYKQIDSGPKGLYATATTDGDGVAEVNYTVPDLGASQASFYIYNIGYELMRQIKSVKSTDPGFDITMQVMKENGSRVTLNDGGTIWERDIYVVVTVDNLTSYFMVLDLVENSAEGGDMLRAVPFTHKYAPDKLVVFPGLNKFYFEILKPPSVGTFHFFLRTRNEDWQLDYKWGHMTCACPSGKWHGGGLIQGYDRGIFSLIGSSEIPAGGLVIEGILECSDNGRSAGFISACGFYGVETDYFEKLLAKALKIRTSNIGIGAIHLKCIGAECLDDLSGYEKGWIIQIGPLGGFYEPNPPETCAGWFVETATPFGGYKLHCYTWIK